MVERYEDFAKNKDIQMLAMLAALILQTPYAMIAASSPPAPLPQRPSINLLPSSIRSPRTSAFDYYTIAQGLNQQPLSPASGRLPSPIAPTLAPSLSSSTSSRGSWTNIFSTGRQFVQDTFNPTLNPSTDLTIQTDRHSLSPIPDKLKVPDSPVTTGAQPFRKRKDSHITHASSTLNSAGATSKSWTETVPHQKGPLSGGSGGSGPGSGVSFSSAGHPGTGGAAKRPPNLRWTNSNQSAVSGVSGVSEKQVVVFEAPEDEEM